MANAYQGEIKSVSKTGGKLKIKCKIGKKKLVGYLHEHDAEIIFADNPMDNDKFLAKYLEKGGKIKVTLG